jgi:predicted HAD superfamily Cof-like phosphohydrolase
MRPNYHQDVKLFHDKFGLVTPTETGFLPDDLHAFRIGFFREEHQEYIDSCNAADLGTAFDSLIDLVYICCGAALLHGIDADFNEMVETTEAYVYDVFTSDEPPKTKPGFLTPKNFFEFNRLLVKNIELYDEAHEKQVFAKTKAALTGIYQSCMMCASDMGCTIEMWDEMWADVQRANMSKVRAERAVDSKRGSVWDVVKPRGWVPPDTDGILAKYLA